MEAHGDSMLYLGESGQLYNPAALSRALLDCETGLGIRTGLGFWRRENPLAPLVIEQVSLMFHKISYSLYRLSYRGS